MGADSSSSSFKKEFFQNEEFDAIQLSDVKPPVAHQQFMISAYDSAVLTVSGSTYIKSYTDKYDENNNWDTAIHAFYAGKGSTINLNGDINIEMAMSDDVETDYGMSAFYAEGEGATINLGSEGANLRIWVIADKPDSISAKEGGSVNFKSSHIQLVGSIDTMDSYVGTKGSKVDLSVSDSGYYWFGDDNTMLNVSVSIPEQYAQILGLEKTSYSGVTEINELLDIPEIVAKIEELRGVDIEDNPQVKDEFNLTVSNGAQWTYFGSTKGEDQGGFKVGSIPKRVSSIELTNGGIINLFDQDIRQTWKEIGLTDLWKDVANINHDYVRIGDLKGNGGIFRLDLDAEIRQNSDMVFIESSTTGGTHYIEPYDLERLESVSPNNTLTFALQEALPDNDGKFVSFAEKQNIYGQSLFDYELEIDSRVIENEDQIKDIHYNSWETDGWDFDASDASKYVNGKEWFIKRVELIESAASIGMRSAGYASYDLAVSMDRRDRRLHDAVFQNEEKDGLWTRIQYGEAGAEHLYNADLTTVYVGYEKATSPDNRLGFSFGYTDGDSDFSDLKGSGELKRYEASVYDTLTFGSHYLDFVARFGQVENDFDVTNQAGTLTTSGSFDQKYAALSAEYGYNFKDEHNVFIEPQVQLQVAYLGDYDYRTERNMKVEADNDVSVIGRVGLRTGKAFESADYAGELYARADVLHQFTDGQDADFSDLSHKVGVTWGDKDTWSTFGVGGYLNWKDNMSFQVDVERTAGGETTDTWLVSGRFNYLF